LYYSKNYDDKMELLSELIDKLNEVLSAENALVDRIISRIDQTPIQEVKPRLKQHLKETNIQKSRLRRIIIQLGGKPTDVKADVSRSFVSTTTPDGNNNLPRKVKSKTKDNGLTGSMPEEYELVQIRRDFAIEHDELVAYDSLIRRMQEMDMPLKNENISLLEKSMQEEESMVYWYKIHTPLILDSLWPKMINTSVRRGQNFLLNHISSKIPLIILYADLVGSTKMSMTLPVDNLVTIIRAFAHQMSHVIDSHGGYVLKYAGDGVISFFPCRANKKNKYDASSISVECGKSMINAVKEEINVILHKIYKYPELFPKVGIDAGENAIVQFGYEQLSPIDILGYSMNVASKITSLTGANKVSIGENVYNSLDRKLQREFHELSISDGRWKYINYGTDKPYKVYTLNS
jgi:adenylate cyclase